ncbi:hypothetical protein G6F63_016462 [Rhizopus arrhizus]|nr:hypothetical protein G6F63_016462 [Rhizopus arrhizus]
MQLDPTRATPAVINNDGLDYVPTNKHVLFGHHFAAIAGAGPLVGPVLAAQEEDETSPRALALRVLALFDAEACQHVPDVVVTARDPMELLAP